MKDLFYKFIHPFRRVYWFIVRPNTRGVKGIPIHGNSVLMIKNSYVRNKYWTFPGGRIKRGEDPRQAAHRETREEVGIDSKQYHFLHTYKNIKEHKRDTVYVFTTVVDSDSFKIDTAEVLEAQWFTIDALPAFLSPSIPQYIPLLKNRVHETDKNKF
ncbi:MAG: hypothetical protein A2677_02240 [Candidatus Komeilibacteria bacterium RIFCSPHIGHO2_01_FULL_52_14]|uniref:Nudix hydrolase domain-containing protein n=1 Tax=Candidatus Komeilibacteria bacterium RIFCSPHIGHO2_01_FULL_52_14 TaxID=1798549 RepID=A0A1G2BI14_9BACT|nr:MAG: hypothetical protein A2677_02240 [Candidatus Komeilibacteria bacterium RIFCSPHIGHO2_01_FULL_52_14]